MKVSRWVPVRPVMSLVTLVLTTTRARAGHRSAGRPVSRAQATAITPAEVTAIVVPRPGAVLAEGGLADGGLTEEALIAFCRERLAGLETPKGVIFATALPETVGGKVLKYKLREQFAGHYQAAEHAATTMGEGEAGGVVRACHPMACFRRWTIYLADGTLVENMSRKSFHFPPSCRQTTTYFPVILTGCLLSSLNDSATVPVS